MNPTRTVVLSAVRIVTVPLVLCATMMVSALHTIFAAPPETLHLDVFIGEADSWNVTSTLIYGKSEAILVDSRFRKARPRNWPTRWPRGEGALKPSSLRIPMKITTSGRRCFMSVSSIRQST